MTLGRNRWLTVLRPDGLYYFVNYEKKIDKYLVKFCGKAINPDAPNDM